MSMFINTKLFISIVFLINFIIFLSATTLAKLDLNQLYQKSNLIVRGRFQDSDTTYINGHIWTRWRFIVDEYVKGTSSSVIEVLQPGGKSGKYITQVSAVKTFQEHDESCLFLFSGQNGLEIIGYSQGAISLYKNQDGDIFVVPDSSNYFLYPQNISRSKSRITSSLSKWDKFLQKGEWKAFVEVMKQNE